MTKSCIHQQWMHGHRRFHRSGSACQAICVQTKDYERAYEAFVAKSKPVFEGN